MAMNIVAHLVDSSTVTSVEVGLTGDELVELRSTIEHTLKSERGYLSFNILNGLFIAPARSILYVEFREKED